MMTTPTAEPCRKCGTVAGCLDHERGKPRRVRGLCGKCHQWVVVHGQVAAYPRVTVLHEPGEAKVCEGCGVCFARTAGTSVNEWAARRFCSHSCWGASRADRLAVIPNGRITLASRGIKPGQPPTDPGLTAEKVWDVGNTNAHRATRWLVQHGHTGLATLATTIWEPAELTTKARAA